MPAGNVTATVTAKTGPGLATVAAVLSNVMNINFRFKDGAFDVYQQDPPKMTSFEYTDVATVTFTPASKTVVIST